MSKAEELIACLEGEIAKRDARIVELESAAESLRLSRDYHHEQEIEYRRLYAAPVSEAKAQGVVMPERWNVPRPMWKDARQPYGNPLNHADIEAAEKFNLALDEVARLNAAPVQQVSVPDGPAKMQWPEIVALVNEVLGCEAHKYPCERGSIGHEMTGINFNSLARIIDRVRYAAPVQQVSVPDGWKLVPVEPTKAMLFACEDAGSIHNQQRGKRIYEAMLAAAPAAPAADAVMVDMYRHLQTVTPYRFKKIQDASVTDGGDVLYFHKDRFDAALLDDMAANCAKGVV